MSPTGPPPPRLRPVSAAPPPSPAVTPPEPVPPEPVPVPVAKPAPSPTPGPVRRSTDLVAKSPYFYVFRNPDYEEIHVEECPRLPDPKDPNFDAVVRGFSRIEEARKAPHVGEFCRWCPVDRSIATAPPTASPPPRAPRTRRKK